MNAFDITLLATHYVLAPTGVDLTGSVLPGNALIVLECTGGIPITVGGQCSPTDNSDTLHLAATGGFGRVSQNPTTGLLFTATYNITGNTGASGVALGFQAGCAHSSVENLCVTIANPLTVSEDREVVQGAVSFNNDSPPPYVLVTANPSRFSEMDHVFAGSSTVTVSGVNGWPGLSRDLVRFSYEHTSGLTVSATGTNPCAVAVCSITLSLNTSIGGFQSVTVFANYVAKDPVTMRTSTLNAVITITVSGPDFSISANPSTVYFAPGASGGSSSLMITSIGGFAGTVQFGDTVSPSGLIVSFIPQSVSGGSGTSVVMFTSTTDGFFQVNITATSGSLFHTLTVLAIVSSSGIPDFIVSASPKTVFLATGSTGSSQISVQSIQGFTESVSLSANVSPTSGLAVSLTPSTVIPPTNRIAYSTVSFSSSMLGTFSVVITGKDGGISHSVILTVTVTQQDFALSTSKSAVGPISVSATDRSVTVTITAVNGFSGSVSLTATISPSSGLTASLNPSSVVGAGTSTLTLNPSSAGTYSVNITGASGVITHFLVVTVTVSNPGPSGVSPLIAPVVLYAMVGVVVVALITLLFTLFRRRSRL